MTLWKSGSSSNPRRGNEPISVERQGGKNAVGNAVGNDVGEERQEGKLKRAVGKGEKREMQLEKEKVGKSRWKEQKNRNCKERKKGKK